MLNYFDYVVCLIGKFGIWTILDGYVHGYMLIYFWRMIFVWFY